MITKKDVEETVNTGIAGLRKEFKEEMSSMRKAIKEDIETAVAQVIETVMKNCAMKEDLKSLATKEELREFKEEVRGEFREVKRQINNLKTDTPTPQELADHERRIKKLEGAVFPA